jgi:hypothetical protein
MPNNAAHSATRRQENKLTLELMHERVNLVASWWMYFCRATGFHRGRFILKTTCISLPRPDLFAEQQSTCYQILPRFSFPSLCHIGGRQLSLWNVPWQTSSNLVSDHPTLWVPAYSSCSTIDSRWTHDVLKCSDWKSIDRQKSQFAVKRDARGVHLSALCM